MKYNSITIMDNYLKYIKYKTKYLELKQWMSGGAINTNLNLNSFDILFQNIPLLKDMKEVSHQIDYKIKTKMATEVERKQHLLIAKYSRERAISNVYIYYLKSGYIYEYTYIKLDKPTYEEISDVLMSISDGLNHSWVICTDPRKGYGDSTSGCIRYIDFTILNYKNIGENAKVDIIITSIEYINRYYKNSKYRDDKLSSSLESQYYTQPTINLMTEQFVTKYTLYLYFTDFIQNKIITLNFSYFFKGSKERIRLYKYYAKVLKRSPSTKIKTYTSLMDEVINICRQYLSDIKTMSKNGCECVNDKCDQRFETTNTRKVKTIVKKQVNGKIVDTIKWDDQEYDVLEGYCELKKGTTTNNPECMQDIDLCNQKPYELGQFFLSKKEFKQYDGEKHPLSSQELIAAFSLNAYFEGILQFQLKNPNMIINKIQQYVEKKYHMKLDDYLLKIPDTYYDAEFRQKYIKFRNTHQMDKFIRILVEGVYTVSKKLAVCQLFASAACVIFLLDDLTFGTFEHVGNKLVDHAFIVVNRQNYDYSLIGNYGINKIENYDKKNTFCIDYWGASVYEDNEPVIFDPFNEIEYLKEASSLRYRPDIPRWPYLDFAPHQELIVSAIFPQEYKFLDTYVLMKLIEIWNEVSNNENSENNAIFDLKKQSNTWQSEFIKTFETRIAYEQGQSEIYDNIEYNFPQISETQLK